jgi:hypothetical protein
MKHPRKVHVFFAVIFYGFIGAAGLLWISQMGRPTLAELFTIEDRTLTYGLGVGVGLLIAGASTLIVKWLSPARILEQEFGWLLGNQNVWEIGLLAILSGVAEEIVFRGALRAALGPIVALVVFAAAHPPFNSRLTLWPLFALAVGILLELEFVWTGECLVAPIITHVVVNFINLLRISVKFRVLEE